MRLCSIPGCERPVHGRGMCHLHCQRDRNGTDMQATVGFRHGFALEFIREAAVYTGDDCLLWPFRLKPEGYGDVKYPGIPGTAAKVVCTIAHGPAPDSGLEVAHWCGNKACVAPKHLRWATDRDNQLDRVRHGTDNRGTKHPMAKLTEAAVRAIKSQPTRRRRDLAAEYGVSETAITHIRTGRSWGWL